MSRRLIATAAIMVAAALSLRLVSASGLPPTAARLTQLPAQFGPWRGYDLPRLDATTEATLGADAYVLRAYDRGGVPVTLFVAYYATQASGRTIHSPLNCLPGTGWEWVDRGYALMAAPRDAAVEINHDVARRGDDEEVMYYWYQSRDRVVASEYTDKLLLIRDALTEHRSDGALVRVTAAAPADREAAVFAETVYPVLTQYLPE